MNKYKQDGWATNGSLRVSNESAIGGKNTLVLHHYRKVFSTTNEKGYVVSPGFNLPEAIDIQPSVVRGSYCSSGDLTRTGYIGAVSNQTSSNTSSITYTVSGGMGSSFTGSGSWLGSFQISPSKPYVSVDCDTKTKGSGSYYWLCEVHLRYAQ